MVMCLRRCAQDVVDRGLDGQLSLTNKSPAPQGIEYNNITVYRSTQYRQAMRCQGLYYILSIYFPHSEESYTLMCLIEHFKM